MQVLSASGSPRVEGDQSGSEPSPRALPFPDRDRLSFLSGTNREILSLP
jgi:hypothetical protein